MRTRKIENEQELIEFQVFMKKFWATYSSSSPANEIIAIYSEDLAEIPMLNLEGAFQILRRRNKYLPAIAEIYQEVKLLQEKNLANKPERQLIGATTSCQLCHDTGWVQVTERTPGSAYGGSGYFCKCGGKKTDMSQQGTGEPMPEFYKEALKQVMGTRTMTARTLPKGWHDEYSDIHSDEIPEYTD